MGLRFMVHVVNPTLTLLDSQSTPFRFRHQFMLGYLLHHFFWEDHMSVFIQLIRVFIGVVNVFTGHLYWGTAGNRSLIIINNSCNRLITSNQTFRHHHPIWDYKEQSILLTSLFKLWLLFRGHLYLFCYYVSWLWDTKTDY